MRASRRQFPEKLDKARFHRSDCGIDVNKTNQWSFIVTRVFGFPSACFGGVHIDFGQARRRFELLTESTVGRHQRDHDDPILVVEVLRDGLGTADVGLSTGTAVVCI